MACSAQRQTDSPNLKLSRAKFEQLVEDLVDRTLEPCRKALADAGLTGLSAALAGQDETAVRAAVVLVRSADAASAEVLAARLAERVLGPERDSDAAAVVAAGGLGVIDAGRAHAALLAELALGPVPHPDLEVRIECAAAALHAGRDEVIPFLLRVLRSITPAELEDPPDWPPKTTMAWAKSRAAEILA